MYVDNAYFLVGFTKDKVLKASGAHVFFDDPDVHLKDSSMVVPSANIPYSFDSPLYNPVSKDIKLEVIKKQAGF